jgi:hypothetical protein
VPVSLPPPPQPGDLITADLLVRLADAVRDVDTRLESVSRRLAILEQGGGRIVPELVPLDTNKFRGFVEELRGANVAILDEPDKSKRLERVKDLWLERRQDILLDDDMKHTAELTEAEWVVLGTAAGIKPSEVAQTLSATRPTSAQAVRTQFGQSAFELDNFANLSQGFIGLSG